MNISQALWSAKTGWTRHDADLEGQPAQLLFIFGSTSLMKDKSIIDDIRRYYPDAILFGCSTSGEIIGTQVLDDTITVTAVRFEHTRIKKVWGEIERIEDSYKVGEKLAKELEGTSLVHVFVLSDGLKINGSELVNGLTGSLSEKVSVTGGMSGDGERFRETYVLYGDYEVGKNVVTALGFYSDSLRVGYGSFGGWDPFGPERLITRSCANVLYELDGKSALELYKKYLGDHARGLPATGLFFPLCIRVSEEEEPLVRTLLSIDEQKGSMTFAGDIPEKAYARLMKANLDRLIDGAVEAANASIVSIGNYVPELAILISCVGRKLVLKQRVEEEIESVSEVLGSQVPIAGFYSYGEISPFSIGKKCELHNQTMTITLFSEIQK